MRILFLRLGLFCIILLFVAYLLDVFISSRLKKSVNLAKGEYSVWNDIYGSKINADLVVYGSSRAWVHIDPQIVSEALNISCYNLGVDGHNFSLQYFRHKELLRFNKWPRIIILSVDIFTFTKYHQFYNFEQFLPYMLFNLRIAKISRGYVNYKPLEFLVPSLRYSGKKEIINNVFSHVGSSYSSNRVRGYRGMDEVWNNDFDSVKNNMTSYVLQTDSTVLKELEAFISECNAKKIKLVMVYSPEYIEGQRFVSNRDELMNLYNSLAQKYKVPFYDCSSDSISYQKNLFYNTQHLNKQGAELFTKELVRSLKMNREFIKFVDNKQTAD